MRKKINTRRDIESRRNIARTTRPKMKEETKRKSDEEKQAQEKETDPSVAPPAAKAKKGGRETEGDA